MRVVLCPIVRYGTLPSERGIDNCFPKINRVSIHSPLDAFFVPKKFHLVPIRDALFGMLDFSDPRKDHE
jgi:hypothetical protein